MLDLDIDFAGSEQDMESYPLRDDNKRFPIYIRYPPLHCHEDKVEEIVAASADPGEDRLFASREFSALQKDHRNDADH